MIFGSDLDGVIFDIFPAIFARLRLLTGINTLSENAYNMEKTYGLSKETV